MAAYPIPTDALDDRLGFVGTAGSGKTYNAGSAVERLLNSAARVVIPDPLGVWYGLALDKDGRGPSTFRRKEQLVVFGGPRGDLPITEHAGALIGETVASMAESAIIDMSELGTKAAERRFMLAFLTALHRKQSDSPLHVIFDEADMWAPQRILDKEGEAMKLLGMMETIVRRGRIKGFIPWLITQRPAVLSKNVLSQIDGLISFKLTSAQDRDAIGDWVEGSADKAQWRQMWANMPTLARGEGVIWIPARGILKTSQFPEKVTFDSSRTPQRGERAASAVTLQPVNLDSLKARLSQVEAETKANDPKALRAEIAKLKSEARQATPVDPAALEHAESRGYQRGFNEGHAAGHASGFEAAQNAARDAIARLTRPPVAVVRQPAPPPIQRPVVKRPITPAPAVEDDTPMSPTVRKIIDEIHRANPVALSFEAAALRAAVSRRSSAYEKYRKQVEASHEIERRHDGRFQSAPGYATPMQAGVDPIEAFCSRLPPSYAAMLRAISSYGGPMTKEEVAEAAGVSPTSSGLSSGLRELMALSLIEKDGEAYVIHGDIAA
jgi:hypothetical protein